VLAEGAVLMSALAASTIRAWIATWIEDTESYAFRQSPRVDGINNEAGSIAHQSFSVYMDDELDLGQMRQRPQANGTRVRQSVRVRFAWRIRPGADALTDYDAALDAAHAIQRQMMQRPTTGALPMHVISDGIPSRVEMDNGKWLMTDVAFNIDHILSLAAVA